MVQKPAATSSAHKVRMMFQSMHEVLWHADYRLSNRRMASKTLSVDVGSAVLLVLLLGDKHRREAAQRGQNGPPHPRRELPLRRVKHVDLHSGRSQGDHFLLQPLLEVLEHAGASCDHDVAVEVFADVGVALEDGLESELVGPQQLFAHDFGGLEQRLRALERLALCVATNLLIWISFPSGSLCTIDLLGFSLNSFKLPSKSAAT